MTKVSKYRQIFLAVEEAVFQRQARTAEEAAKYAEWLTGIPHINRREVEKLIHRVATQYK